MTSSHPGWQPDKQIKHRKHKLLRIYTDTCIPVGYIDAITQQHPLVKNRVTFPSLRDIGLVLLP